MHEIVIAALVMLFALQSPVVWGGDHIEMHVTDRGATIEFDCAHGAFEGALKPDAEGRFEKTGTFNPERGGPTRDDAPPPLAATYAGMIKDDAMSLRVTITGQDVPTMTFELARGRAGNVRKCR